MGPEALAVVAGMLGVTLIAGSRLRARRRRTARAAATGWAPAVAAPTASFATGTGRWGESRAPAADFDDWHEEEAPRAEAPAATVPAAGAGVPPPAGAPFTLEPDLDQLDDEALDDVFAGRSPAPEPGGRFAPDAPSPLVPDARGVFGEAPPPPRGGAAGFRSAPRRTGLGGMLRSPAVRAALYAVAGIALVALTVNLAFGGDEEPAPAVERPAPAVQAPQPAPSGPSPAEIAAQREAAAAQRTAALDAAGRAERRAVAAERRAIRRRRAAAARRRREADARRRAAQQQPAPVPQTTAPAPPAGPPAGSGGGGGGGGARAPQCELGCIG